MADLEYHVADGVATARLNRPEKKNAFTLEMLDTWCEILREARHDDDVRVLVLTGAGDAFCSGVDLDAFGDIAATPLTLRNALSTRIHPVNHALEELDKPVIASMPGIAVGAGLDMALACDIRIAAESARFSERYIKLGLVPGEGGCWYLPRLVGVSKALELLLTGEFFDAAEALRIGLVNRVVPDANLESATSELALQLASAPRVTTALIKRTVYQSVMTDLRTSLSMIASHSAVAQLTSEVTALQADLSPTAPARAG
jgi:enoyl-CoA hydratase/carnithine racemase